jgi:quercetin dioxygenase-like cupin family protein
MSDDYTYIDDLAAQVAVPKDGILSRILYKDEQVNVTLFGFDTGQELSEHTAGSPAIIHILQGEARLTIAGAEHESGPGAWIHLPARTPHSLVAKTPVVMLLLLLKSRAGS